VDDGELVARVRAELKLRNWSTRKAEVESGGIASATTFGNWFAKGGPPTPKVREALARAFEWPDDWPENPPPLQRSRHDPDVLEELRDIRQQLIEMAAGVDASTAERRKLLSTTTKALVLLVEMEARQRRAFALLDLDPTVDLDDSRLDDPAYRASLRVDRPVKRPAARARTTARRPAARNH
jgi:hypothetical protein